MNDVSRWNNFLSAAAGAAATLTGLVFVGVSISLLRILEHARLSNWALEALSMFAAVLFLSMLGLVPDQSFDSFGYEVLFIAVILEIIVIYLGISLLIFSPKEFRFRQWRNIVISQIAILPLFIAAVLLISSIPTGLYWLVTAFIFLFLKALADAWVLLLEIHR